jgi:hypothetical protein
MFNGNQPVAGDVFTTFVMDLNKGYAEGTTGGALPCSIILALSIEGSVGSEIKDCRVEISLTEGCVIFATRCAITMLALRDSFSGAFMVTRI